MADTMIAEGGDPILEIRDPLIDAGQVIQRVHEAVRERETSGAYGPDPAMLGPESLRPMSSQGSEPVGVYLDLQAARDALAQMTTRAQLAELTFTSRVPLLGRLIAAVRSAWSWMAARWIGRHIVSQQSAFNVAAVQLGDECVHWLNVQQWRQRQLQDQLGDLEARLAGLEETLGRAKEREEAQ